MCAGDAPPQPAYSLPPPDKMLSSVAVVSSFMAAVLLLPRLFFLCVSLLLLYPLVAWAFPLQLSRLQ